MRRHGVKRQTPLARRTTSRVAACRRGRGRHVAAARPEHGTDPQRLGHRARRVAPAEQDHLACAGDGDLSQRVADDGRFGDRPRDGRRRAAHRVHAARARDDGQPDARRRDRAREQLPAARVVLFHHAPRNKRLASRHHVLRLFVSARSLRAQHRHVSRGPAQADVRSARRPADIPSGDARFRRAETCVRIRIAVSMSDQILRARAFVHARRELHEHTVADGASTRCI